MNAAVGDTRAAIELGHTCSNRALLNTVVYKIILSEISSKSYLIFLKAEIKWFSDKNWKVEVAEGAVWSARTGSLQWLRELFAVQELCPCSGRGSCLECKNWVLAVAKGAVCSARTVSLQWLRELFGVQELGPCSG